MSTRISRQGFDTSPIYLLKKHVLTFCDEELCADAECCEADTVCCNDGFCCPEATPVCQLTGCCPTGDIECGAVAPESCHPPDTTCCEGGKIYCPDDETCCGTDTCCPEVDADGNAVKCCPDEGNGAVCCGEFDTCCDGYCCGEGATCAENEECMPATIQWDDVADGLAICENTCLGIRSQLSKPGVVISSQWQLLTYDGKGTGTSTRLDGPCGPGSCCSAASTTAGTDLQCDEYPYASTMEGGFGAWAACIPQPQNSRQGGRLSALFAGKHKGFQFYTWVIGETCNNVDKNILPGLDARCPAQVILPF